MKLLDELLSIDPNKINLNINPSAHISRCVSDDLFVRIKPIHTMKIQSLAEGRLRLNKLSEKIDKLIAKEEAMLPVCATLHIITDEDALQKHIYSKGRYIKFGLIVYEGCLPDS